MSRETVFYCRCGARLAGASARFAHHCPPPDPRGRWHPNASLPAHLRMSIPCPCGEPSEGTWIKTGAVCDVVKQCAAGHLYRIALDREAGTATAVYVQPEPAA
jgi:hypothetical protein